MLAHLSMRDLAARWGYSYGYVRQLRSLGLLPEPIFLGRSPRWRLVEIEFFEAIGGLSKDCINHE